MLLKYICISILVVCSFTSNLDSSKFYENKVVLPHLHYTFHDRIAALICLVLIFVKPTLEVAYKIFSFQCLFEKLLLKCMIFIPAVYFMVSP